MVYCTVYPSGTQTKDWNAPGGVVKASNPSIDSPGEVWGVMWDENGLVKHQTVGATINHHRGNVCGFGAAFAIACVAEGNSESVYRQLELGWLETFLGFNVHGATRSAVW